MADADTVKRYLCALWVGCVLYTLIFFGGVSIRGDLIINEKIRDKEIRLIDADGSALGIMPTRQALDLAANKNLDLVKIAPQATPPVCKIMDYGKYRFEMSKKEKEQKKHQHVVVVKEIRLSSNIDEHDFMTKMRNAEKFLKEGDKVKVSIRFRGREITHASIGEQQLKRFGQELAAVSIIEKLPKLEGRSMTMHLTPRIEKEKPTDKEKPPKQRPAEKPIADRPAEKPAAEKPSADRPAAQNRPPHNNNRPSNNRPSGDRPHNNRPAGDRPRPQNDRSKPAPKPGNANS